MDKQGGQQVDSVVSDSISDAATGHDAKRRRTDGAAEDDGADMSAPIGRGASAAEGALFGAIGSSQTSLNPRASVDSGCSSMPSMQSASLGETSTSFFDNLSEPSTSITDFNNAFPEGGGVSGVGRMDSVAAPTSSSSVSISISKPTPTISSSSASSGVDSPSLRIRLPNPSYRNSQCSTVSSASGSERGGVGSGGGSSGPDAHPEFRYARSVSIDETRPHHMIENMVHQEFERDVNDVYKRLDSKEALLGSGLNGQVVKVTHRVTGVSYALKTLELKHSRTALHHIKNEISIMAGMDHPNIVRLVEAFYTSTHVHLIMELCLGGELYDHLAEQQLYSEESASKIIRKLLLACRYLHDHNVVHRDLKLENVLFDVDGPDAELKVCDFGLSKHFKTGKHMHTLLGTPFYIAPEVLAGDYDEKCDLWSVGVITYMLLSGSPPFDGHTNSQIMSAVRAGEVVFDPELFGDVSPLAREFILTLLQTDPSQRPTAAQALQHPWLVRMAQGADDSAARGGVLGGVVRNLVKFRSFSAFKRIALEVVAFSLAPQQIRDLRIEFNKFDVENSGEISVGVFRDVLSRSVYLQPKDVEMIFEKINVSHNGVIHWHEFIAAAVDSSEVDEAHLKNAFDHLDRDGKGSITKDDLAFLVGEDQQADEVTHIFEEVHQDRISYETFLRICRADNATVAAPPGKGPPTSLCEHHPHQIRKRRRSSIKAVLPIELAQVGVEVGTGPEVVTPKT